MLIRPLSALGYALLLTIPAAAQDEGTPATSPEGSVEGKATPAAPQTTDAAPASTADENYEQRVLAGLQQIVLRDAAQALSILRGAAAIEPQRAAAFCHIGDAQRLLGDSKEALAAYDSCIRFAEAAKDPRHARMGRVGRARVLEGQPARREETKKAYQTVRDSAANHQAAATLAEGRLAALAAVEALEEKYVAVRRRIEERAKKQTEAKEDGAPTKKKRRKR